MRKGILAAAAATVALVWFAPDDDIVAPAAATARPAQPAVDPAPMPVLAQAPAIPPELHIQRRVDGEEAGDLFGAGPGAVAPPAPLKPAAARAEAVNTAAAPAAGSDLPLIFLGSYRDGGITTYLLQADGQDIAARIGDTIAGGYRLDGAHEGALSFTYLPRNQPMTLTYAHTGDAN